MCDDVDVPMREYPRPEVALDELGLLDDAGPGVSRDALLLLGEVPEAAPYLHVRVEYPTPPFGAMGMMVPRTKIFFDVSRCRQLRGDAVVAFAVYSMTQSAPAAFFATSVRKLIESLQYLSDDEDEVVRALCVRSKGQPYSLGVPESVLVAAFAETLVDAVGTIDRLEEKGIVRRTRGQVKLSY